jgi:Arc/MetJ family transcription regulator
LKYSVANKDKNFIPVLKKITQDNTLDEGIRQRSAEILEMPWVGKNSFTETRTPQTSEILKLLKANSVESKRLAICMIGKFKLTDMLQDVANCLSLPGLETDSAAVLLAFRHEVGNELQRLYLKSSGNIKTSKAILRILRKTDIQENILFLFERLWSNSKEIKEVALDCLVDCNFKVPEEAIGRMNQLICDVTRTLVWIISAQISLKKSGVELLINALNKEIIHWKRFLFGLLYITYESGRVDNIKKVPSDDETCISKYFPELFEMIFNEQKKTLFWFFPRVLSDDQKQNKLFQLFPSEMPEFKNVIEDILNHDYNQISLWAKACALRNIKEIKDENLSESVIALMFSPEEILQEEAAKLIARSNHEKYRSVSQRISPLAKMRIDNIINNETHQMELLFEKTKFLSSLFPEISEDKLLFLAKEIKFIKNSLQEYSFDPCGIVLWAYRSDATNPDVVKVFLEDSQDFNNISLPYENSHVYLLSLKTIEEFHYLFPEDSFAILKYIDDHEESEN